MQKIVNLYVASLFWLILSLLHVSITFYWLWKFTIKIFLENDVSSLNPVIYTTIGKDRSKKGLTNLPEDRLFACEWLIDGYQCPIVKGNKVIWRLNLPVSPIEMVSDSASIEIQMRSHDNSTQFCAIIVGYVSPLSLV